MILAAPWGTPGVEVGKTICVRVLVGVNSSAPMDVTVGVKVSGVEVDVANRFWVGIGVSVGAEVGVGEAAGGGGVAVARNCGILIFGKPEQPARKIPNTRT